MANMNQEKLDIKAVIGLGNPGPNYYYTRHSIGFRVLDELAREYGLSWQEKENQEIATLIKDSKKVLLIKPQTFMNSSGKVIPSLLKQGIKSENILVVHDELELPLGTVKIRVGGSARGHNGLKSIISACGDQFARLQFGIGRPTFKEDVPNYVLEKFKENELDLEYLIQKAVSLIQEKL